MAKRKSNTPHGEALEDIHRRLDDEKYKLEHAGSLLRILAEHCQENRHGDTETAWFEAEYLGNRIAEHVEALGKVSDDIDRLGMEVRNAARGVLTPVHRPPLEVVPSDGDAA